MVLGQPVFWALVVFALWLAALSFWLYKTSRHYSRLVSTTSKQGLKEILEKLLDEQGQIEEHVRKIEEALGELDKKTQSHVQKVGLVRFNPFAETGGDQSFALALLDAEDTGFVLLSLHGREGTRIYVKPIFRGKSKYELSREEKQALEQAKKR